MNRRLPLILVAVVSALCLVGVVITAIAAGGQAVAYRVNESEVSQSTIDRQLDDLANFEATSRASNSEGSVNSRATAQVLTLNIARDLLHDAAARQDVEITADDRAAARSDLGQQLQSYPASYRDLVVDAQATATALGLTSTEAINQFLARQFRRSDVYVNPRYGRWSPRFGVCPPTGCASTATGSGG